VRFSTRSPTKKLNHGWHAGILYISTPILESSDSSPELLLRPYLDKTLSLNTSQAITPLFTVFYIQHSLADDISTTTAVTPNLLVTPPPSQLLPESLDSAATDAETVFWKAIGFFNSSSNNTMAQRSDGNPEIGTDEIDSFWPTMSDEIDNDADDW